MVVKKVKYGLFSKNTMLLFSILAIAEADGGHEKENCILTTVSTDPVCIAEVKCLGALAITTNTIETWDCDFSYDSYILNVKVDEVEGDILNDDTEYDYDVSDHIKEIIITNQIELRSVPIVIYELFSEIVNINLSNNMIQSLNLDAFAGLVLLRTLNVSCNFIKRLDVNLNMRIRPISSALEVLDLSHNKIKKIDNNSFKNCMQLQYLNLSYNNIISIHEKAFDGLINLESLQLSFNEISHIGFIFVPLINLKHLLLDHNNLPSLLETDLVTLTDLVELNVSFNKLIYIDDYTFSNLNSMLELDLSHNEKCFFPKSLLINNLGIMKIVA